MIARFDVLRSDKKRFSLATVTKVDFSGSLKRIMFHFAKTASHMDEWVPFGSSRIAPLYSKVLKTKKALIKGSQATTEGTSVVSDPQASSSFTIGGKANDMNFALFSDTPTLPKARFDVFRSEKKRFFKAIVKDTDKTCTPIKVLFHFLKTSVNADEWIEYGSDRIRPYKSAVPATTTKEQKRRKLENQAAKSIISTTVTIDSTMSSTGDEGTPSTASTVGPTVIGLVPNVFVEMPISETSEPVSNSSSCGVDVLGCGDRTQLDSKAMPSQPRLYGKLQDSSVAHSDTDQQIEIEGRESFQLPYPARSADTSTAASELFALQGNDSRCRSPISNHFQQPAVSYSIEKHPTTRPLGRPGDDSQISNYQLSDQGNLQLLPSGSKRHNFGSEINHYQAPIQSSCLRQPSSTPHHFSDPQINHFPSSSQSPHQEQQQPPLSSSDHFNDPQINHCRVSCQSHYPEQQPPLSSPQHSNDPQINHCRATDQLDYPQQQQPPVPTPHHFNMAGYHQTLPTGPEVMVQQQQLNGASRIGMPNHPTTASTCHQQLGNSSSAAAAAQYELQHHQWPQLGNPVVAVQCNSEIQPQNHHDQWPQQQQPQQPLSGLDVLALLTERLEVVCEQQPNLSPEQALQQFVQSQGLHFLFRR
jgi:hypothetical protein